MCGIAGYFYKSGAPVRNSEVVLNMLQLQKHRGPDDSGVRAFSWRAQRTEEYPVQQARDLEYDFEGILGFNRLSILDLSEKGHQPMCSADEKVILAFNGEIYNAFDFREELIADGYKFRSATDTEVILALYLKYGLENMLMRLNGMFAIVLVDLRTQQLMLARDRFGIKPLYIFENQNRVAFASEIKSFLALPDFKPALNHSLLDEFLIFRNTLNSTLFNQVECLEPGTVRVYSSGDQVVRRFFSIDTYQRKHCEVNEANTVQMLASELRKSVHRQLMSDVKLGCQLSGGIDSSLVANYANEMQQENLLESISIVFENKAYSEETYVDQVSTSLGLKAHKYTLRSTTYLQHFKKATWHFEAPLNHPNTIGIYHLSREARKHVTVLLSGEGADEVFGGYDRFLQVLHPYEFKTYLSGLRRHGAVLKHIGAYHDAAYRAIMGAAYMPAGTAAALNPTFNYEKALVRRREIYDAVSGSIFDRQVKYEMLTFLPDLLLRQDKMSMAHGIENRVPFLDNELVDHAFKIPISQMVGTTNRGRQLKWPLKLLAAQKWGDSFAFREKSGFGIPLREYFSDSDFQAYLLDEIIPGIKTRGIFNASIIQKWVLRTQDITSQQLDALWIMISFEAWAQRFKIHS